MAGSRIILGARGLQHSIQNLKNEVHIANRNSPRRSLNESLVQPDSFANFLFAFLVIEALTLRLSVLLGSRLASPNPSSLSIMPVTAACVIPWLLARLVMSCGPDSERETRAPNSPRDKPSSDKLFSVSARQCLTLLDNALANSYEFETRSVKALRPYLPFSFRPHSIDPTVWRQ